MNRVVRAATIGVLVLSPVALSACSAGQIAQTATQDRDIRGGQADLGSIHLRTATTAYPQSGSYEEGGDARLLVAIANSGPTDDELTDISGPGFETYEVVDPSAEEEAPTGFTIPAGGNVYVGEGGPQVTLTGLTEALTRRSPSRSPSPSATPARSPSRCWSAPRRWTCRAASRSTSTRRRAAPPRGDLPVLSYPRATMAVCHPRS